MIGPNFYFILLIVTSFTLAQNVNARHEYNYVTADFEEEEIYAEIGTERPVVIKFSRPFNVSAVVYITYQEEDSVIRPEQTRYIISSFSNMTIGANDSRLVALMVHGLEAGTVIIGVNSTSPEFLNRRTTFCRVTVIHSWSLMIFAQVIGWMYFVFWTLSFYPQVILNFQRKSVVGLDFDYVLSNIVGHIAYGLFNLGLYWIPEVKREYKAIHPRGFIPVELNDVVFSINAVAITGLNALQCFIYERGDQKVSRVCQMFMGMMGVFVTISLILCLSDVITWLTYLYYFSYLKLVITFLKYVPQVLMNYKRQSTEGFSIGNILLDFTGGILSILQMLLTAHNDDDWPSLYGDPTKLGLGVLTVMFDVIFLVQHYCLYRHTRVSTRYTPYTIQESSELSCSSEYCRSDWITSPTQTERSHLWKP